MSLTNSKNDDRETEEDSHIFFNKVLCPLAERIRDKSNKLFASNRTENTYYISREEHQEHIFPIDSIDIDEELKKMWIKGNASELVDIIPELMTLMNKIKQQNPQINEEVSPFIYVFF